jgi:hypothetical protein
MADIFRNRRRGIEEGIVCGTWVEDALFFFMAGVVGAVYPAGYREWQPGS